MAETWSVFDAGPHWNRSTRSWEHEHRLVAEHVSRPEADRLLEADHARIATPDPQEVP